MKPNRLRTGIITIESVPTGTGYLHTGTGTTSSGAPSSELGVTDLADALFPTNKYPSMWSFYDIFEVFVGLKVTARAHFQTFLCDIHTSLNFELLAEFSTTVVTAI